MSLRETILIDPDDNDKKAGITDNDELLTHDADVSTKLDSLIADVGDLATSANQGTHTTRLTEIRDYLDTVETKLATIIADLGTYEGNRNTDQDLLNTRVGDTTTPAAGTLLDRLLAVKTAVDTVNTTLTSNEGTRNTDADLANTRLTEIRDYLDGVETKLDTLHSDLTGIATAANQSTEITHLVEIRDYLDTVETVLGTISANLTTYEGNRNTDQDLLNTRVGDVTTPAAGTLLDRLLAIKTSIDTTNTNLATYEGNRNTDQDLLNTRVGDVTTPAAGTLLERLLAVKTAVDTVNTTLGTYEGNRNTDADLANTRLTEIRDYLDLVETKLDTLHSDLIAATPAGSNIIGKVGIDQTTPGTTNAVVIKDSGGDALDISSAGAAAIRSPDLEGTGTLPDGSTTVTLALDGHTNFYMNFSGTWAGTIICESSIDGGTTWGSSRARVVSAIGGGIASTATANGSLRGVCFGWTHVRARFSSYTSGTASVRIRANRSSALNTQVEAFSDVMGTGTLVNVADTISATNNGSSSFLVNILGTLVGTVVVEGTIDFVNWFTLPSANTQGVWESTGIWAVTAAGLQLTGNAAGCRIIRAKVVTATSGTSTGWIVFTPGSTNPVAGYDQKSAMTMTTLNDALIVGPFNGGSTWLVTFTQNNAVGSNVGFYGSMDGVTWQTLYGIRQESSVSTPAYNYNVSGVSNTLSFGGAMLGYKYFRVLLYAHTSGSLVVTANITQAPGAMFLAQSVPPGSAVIGKVGIDQTTQGTTNAVTLALTTPVSIEFSASQGVTVVDTWQVLTSYTVPVSRVLMPLQFHSASATAGYGAAVRARYLLGTYNLGTGVFTDGNAVAAPLFFTRMYAEVTTVLSAATNVVTATYTDELGNTGNSATVTMISAGAVGRRMYFALSAGDIGVMDVTACSDNGAQTGVVAIYGEITLGFHRALANDTRVTDLDAMMSIPAGYQVCLEIIASVVTATQRDLVFLFALR